MPQETARNGNESIKAGGVHRYDSIDNREF